MNCGCRIISPEKNDFEALILFCPLHAVAEKMKAELERLRDLVGEADYEIIDAVIAKTERKE